MPKLPANYVKAPSFDNPLRATTGKHALMERVLHVYEPAAEDAGKPLHAEIAGELAMSGDRELVTQLVSNLLENALSHTPARTPVTRVPSWIITPVSIAARRRARTSRPGWTVAHSG